MSESSVGSIIEELNELKLVSEEYKEKIKNDLFTYYGSVDKNNVINISNSLLGYSFNNTLTGRFDLPFLTLSEQRVKKYVEGFNSTDNDLKLKYLGNFKVDPDGLFERLNYCIDYNIPYKDENSVLFSEINFELESSLYLRGMYLKRELNKDLTEEEIEKFSKVCAYLQKIAYEKMHVKLLIVSQLEDAILNKIKSDPNLTVSEIASSLLDELSILKDMSDYPIYNAEYESDYRGNGRR